jgi:hypothetical protein
MSSEPADHHTALGWNWVMMGWAAARGLLAVVFCDTSTRSRTFGSLWETIVVSVPHEW